MEVNQRLFKIGTQIEAAGIHWVNIEEAWDDVYTGRRIPREVLNDRYIYHITLCGKLAFDHLPATVACLQLAGFVTLEAKIDVPTVGDPITTIQAYIKS